MTYDLLVLAHVLCVIVWLGAGLTMLLLSTMADRAGDAGTFAALVRLNSALGLRLFVPASLGTLVLGLLAVAAGPWSLGALWLVLALAGYACTFLMGMLVFKPRAEALAAAADADGHLGPDATAQARELLRLARLDYVVLVAVVGDMVLKPSGDDLGRLAVLAAWVLVGAALALLRRPATTPAVPA